MKNEYKRHPCIYCGAGKLRRKQENDWRPGEKNGRGHYPRLYTYWYCDGCHKTSISNKDVVITASTLAVGQYFLWWFLNGGGIR